MGGAKLSRTLKSLAPADMQSHKQASDAWCSNPHLNHTDKVTVSVFYSPRADRANLNVANVNVAKRGVTFDAGGYAVGDGDDASMEHFASIL